MKTIVTSIILLISITINSQEYSSWEYEAHVGGFKTTVGTADGYHNYFATPFSYDIGITHFVTPQFGIKASLAYFALKSNKQNNYFRTDYNRISLLGTWNLNNSMGFDKWYTIRLDAGLGYSAFIPKVSNALIDRETAGHVMGSINNLIKLNQELHLNIALEVIAHYNMNYTFDGTQSTGDPLDASIGRNTGISDGTIYNLKVGIIFSAKKKYKNPHVNVINNYITNDTTIVNKHYYKYTVLDRGDPYKEKVYFPFDSDTLTMSQVSTLDRLYLKLKDNPTHKLRIIGHCDYRGSDKYNEILATDRAYRIYMFLNNAGISKYRLEYISKGRQDNFTTHEDITVLDRIVTFERIQ